VSVRGGLLQNQRNLYLESFAMSMNESFVESVQTPGALSPEELARTQAMYESMLVQSDAMATLGRIPKSYAEALMDVAEARGQVVQVGMDYHDFVHEAFPALPGLEVYLDSPAINKKKKDEIIVQLLEGKATPLFIDFLRVLNSKDRLGMLRFIGIAYRTIYEERKNRIRVLVESASPLSEEQWKSLTESLVLVLGKRPIIVAKEKPELIGGLVIHAGDKVFDTSVRTQLFTLRNQLLARGTHEIQSRRDRFSHH